MIGDTVFRAGGQLADHAYTASMEYLQLQEGWHDKMDDMPGEWVQGCAMSTPRYRPGSVLLNGVWYMVGGTSPSGTLSTGEWYDPGEDKWVALGSGMCLARAGLGLAVCEGRLVAIGGYNSGALQSMETYDPREGKWAMVNEEALPHPLDGPGLCGGVCWEEGRQVWIEW